MEQDFALAQLWFERGAGYVEQESSNCLGIMWRDGLIPGQDADFNKALQYFNMASHLELSEAQVNIGKLYYG